MITTGDPGLPLSSARKTEIVDVANGVSCSDLSDFPDDIIGAVGANLDGTPVVCGGYGSSVWSDKCYRLTNGMWEEFATMKEKREAAAAVVHNDKLHVFGGSRGASGLKTSEIISVDGEISNGPELPKIVESHAMTSINNTVSLLSGGSRNHGTWRFRCRF